MNFYFSVRRLEALLASHSNGTPVYYDTQIEFAPTISPLSRVRLFVIASDVADGMGRFCRIHIGSYEAVNGEPMDKKHADEVDRRAHDAKVLVGELTRLFGRRAIEGQIALPRDLRLLEGESERLRFNTALGRYELGAPLAEVE